MIKILHMKHFIIFLLGNFFLISHVTLGSSFNIKPSPPTDHSQATARTSQHKRKELPSLTMSDEKLQEAKKDESEKEAPHKSQKSSIALPSILNLKAKIAPKTDYNRFEEILKSSKPVSLPIPREITAKDEDHVGSRKWVKLFTDEKDDAHKWHKDMAVIIKELRKINDGKLLVPLETNFAVARLIFVFTDNKKEIFELPYFFISGWPANGHMNGIKEFAKMLTEEQLGETLKKFKEYELRFITKRFKGKTETPSFHRDYKLFRKEISGIVDKERTHETPLIGTERLEVHLALVEKADDSILAKLYFHSEQAIWMTIKEEIEKYKQKIKRRSSGDLRAFMSKSSQDPIQSVFVDICSYYDMCWCCGDTLASCSHIKTFNTNVYMRVSGCNKYFDRPFETRYSLRDHKEEFAGYKTGTSFIKPSSEHPEIKYKPYIAHATTEDL